MQKNQSFTEGKILSPLISFALPVLLALFLQAMYGAVDLMVVGQFNAALEVSAVSTGSQMMHTITIVITGLSMGITILAGQKIGEKRPEEAGRVIGSGICLFGILSIFLTAGIIFIVAYNVLGSIFRGIGDSRMPLITVTISCILNIIGDLFFVGALKMGVSGAALATVLSQGASVLLSLGIIRKRKLPFPFLRSYIRFDKQRVCRIFTLGAPIALQDLLVSISF